MAGFTRSDYPGYYEALARFVDAVGLYVELTVFTSTQGLMANVWDQQAHLDRTADAVRGKPNVLLELANEIDQHDNAPSPLLTRPSGVLISRGSNGADSVPPRHDAPWDYELYHTNDLDEWHRKTGHNAMEWADQSGRPCLSNENTRFIDRDRSTYPCLRRSEGRRAAVRWQRLSLAGRKDVDTLGWHRAGLRARVGRGRPQRAARIPGRRVSAPRQPRRPRLHSRLLATTAGRAGTRHHNSTVTVEE
jgi:hypothetical protein